MRRGFTLVEVMLASAIFALLTLATFEGVIFSSRIARANAELLAAEAVAWDAVWKRFNESYDSLSIGETFAWQDLPAAAAPELAVYDTAAKLKVSVNSVAEVGWPKDMKEIRADVEWGPAGRRRRLSSEGHPVLVRRGNLGRAP